MTNKVTKFLKDHTIEILIPVAAGTTAGALFYFGYRKGLIDASQIHAKAILEGEALNVMVNAARQTGDSIEFLWDFVDTAEDTKFAVSQVK